MYLSCLQSICYSLYLKFRWWNYHYSTLTDEAMWQTMISDIDSDEMCQRAAGMFHWSLFICFSAGDSRETEQGDTPGDVTGQGNQWGVVVTGWWPYSWSKGTFLEVWHAEMASRLPYIYQCKEKHIDFSEIQVSNTHHWPLRNLHFRAMLCHYSLGNTVSLHQCLGQNQNLMWTLASGELFSSVLGQTNLWQ